MGLLPIVLLIQKTLAVLKLGKNEGFFKSFYKSLYLWPNVNQFVKH